MTQVRRIDELAALTGQHLGYSEYQEITQEQVNLFAAATGDHQWIHEDVERARSGPFGGTIAHGYLTLSLLPVLLHGVLQVEGIAMGVNYGTNKVRFTSPVPVGATIRAGATLASFEPFEGGATVTLDVIIEIRDAARPACVAQVIYRYYR